MARHDVYPAPDGRCYLLDVQTDLLSGLTTRIVVPLLPEEDAPLPARHLNPLVELDGTRHVMATQFLATVPSAILQDPVATVADRADEITRALDMIFHGF